MSFEQSSSAIVHLAWERLLGLADGALAEASATRSPRLEKITRSGDSASFIRLFGGSVLSGPEWFLQRASGLSDEKLTLSGLLAIGQDHGARSVGSAELFFADDLEVINPEEEVVVSLDKAELEQLRAASPADDVNESGILELDHQFTMMLAEQSIASAGYRQWQGLLAQLSVLVDPQLRRNGYGFTVAGIAAHEALGAGLIPQWRASVDNPASKALAEKLGFIHAGSQTTVVF
ncbi:GNAT family N-acetyltransferase [Psychromicrobium lacuslunae]|uniref:N-acetyltransferase domain-containing protein n=1 Tax=Psychromicrobium lacuslunae TaxID=1618207 RepID=A0A0D4C084_9MICC|nr:GNAT family N-acetyltransferase [Psychromicrobium lacuslunae]AJT41766.1 hypothetical protein UM93_10010 [Psychromicrobium lacuslunae]